MPRVVHFEIHASDPDALMAFYSGLLDWTSVAVPAQDYWLIETGPEDEPGIGGGLVRRPVAGPADSPAMNAFVCTVQVESLDAVLEKGDELGAVVALPKMPLTGIGWLAYIKDPDGNVLGLLQPDPAAA
jgi:hypothetical protein